MSKPRSLVCGKQKAAGWTGGLSLESSYVTSRDERPPCGLILGSAGPDAAAEFAWGNGSGGAMHDHSGVPHLDRRMFVLARSAVKAINRFEPTSAGISVEDTA
jgi:hypothetical protein